MGTGTKRKWRKEQTAVKWKKENNNYDTLKYADNKTLYNNRNVIAQMAKAERAEMGSKN